MTKTTKKLGLLASLSLGILAYGQVENYEGKVGINIDKPKATLDIAAYKEDGSTKEGLLMPRLGKTALSKIASPTTSTLIYVNDVTYTTGTDTTADTRVSEVDTVGFYFYNGTKWVKMDNDTDTSIWKRQAVDQTNPAKGNNIVLMDGGDIEKLIKYTPEGQYWNVPKDYNLRETSYFNPTTNLVETEKIDFEKDVNQAAQGAVINVGYADKLFTSSSKNIWRDKKLVSNYLVADEKDNTSNITRLFTEMNQLQTNAKSSKAYSALYAQVNDVEHYGSAKVGWVIGSYNNGGIIGGGADRVIGTFSQAGTRSSQPVNIVEASYTYANPRSSSTIDGLYGTRNHVYLDQRSSNKIGNAMMSNNIAETKGFKGTIGRLVGVNVSMIDVEDTTQVNEAYGLRILNVTKGKQKNYAIYTGSGKVRLGDGVAIGNMETPSAKLDVGGYIKVGSSDATADKNLQAGMIRFNSRTKKFQGYTGTEWVDLH